MNSETPITNPLQTVPPPTWHPLIPWLACVVLLSSITVTVLYRLQTRTPAQITIAGGPPDGCYHKQAESLAKERTYRLKIWVKVDKTNGSLENLPFPVQDTKTS